MTFGTEPISAAIWFCLNHYDFENASFLAEKLHAEVDTEDTLHLLATCYYRQGSTKRAQNLLESRRTKSYENKYLLAKCYFDQKKFFLAEQAIRNDGILGVSEKNMDAIREEFGSLSAHVLLLLGQCFRGSGRVKLACEFFRASLRCSPFLWSSFAALCQEGAEEDPSVHFRADRCPIYAVSVGTAARATTTTTTCDTNAKGDSFQKEELGSFAASTGTPSMSFPSDDPKPIPFQLLSVRHSPATPSFGMLVTPTSDGRFVTPSPTAPSMVPPPAPLAERKSAPRKKGSDVDRFLANLETSSDVELSSSTSAAVAAATSTPMSAVKSTMKSKGKVDFRLPETGPRRSARLSKLNDPKRMDTRSLTSKGKRNTAADSPLVTPSPAPSLHLSDLEAPTQSSTPLFATKHVDVSALSGIEALSSTPATEQQLAEPPPQTTEQIEAFMSLLIGLGKAYGLLCRYECKEALAAFAALPPHQNQTTWVRLQVARALYESNQYNKAKDVYREIRLTDPHQHEDMDLYSTLLWHCQEKFELSKLAMDLKDSSKKSPQTWCAVGNLFSLDNDHESALKFFQRAVQLDPDFTYGYTLLGHEYLATDNLDKALDSFRAAMTADTRHYNAWYGIGMVYFKQEKNKLAITYFKRAFSINRSSAVLCCHIGMAQQAEKRFELALRTITKAIDLDPRNPVCHYRKATVLVCLQRYKDALAELEELEKTVSNEAALFFLKGQIYKKLGEGDRYLSVLNLSWAMQLDPRTNSSKQVKEVFERQLNMNDEDGAAAAALADEDSQDNGVEEEEEEEAMGEDEGAVDANEERIVSGEDEVLALM